jgi:hypothetical protein
LVNFIGDPSHAEIGISKIEKFDKKFEEFSKTKKRTLSNSIYLAQKIIKGEISFNNHLNHQSNRPTVKAMKITKKVSDSLSSVSI